MERECFFSLYIPQQNVQAYTFLSSFIVGGSMKVQGGNIQSFLTLPDIFKK